MKSSEFSSILVAIIIFTIVIGFSFALNQEWSKVAQAFLFSVLIIIISVMTKKVTAYLLDADVEHEIWGISGLGINKFKKEIPTGIILPLIFSIISFGTIKILSLLTYETRALKARASKRFGFYSFTEMTDWHTGLIGAAGIVSVLLISLITYFLPANLEYFASVSVFYAFVNMLPISNLDGTQIFFGSRVLWTILAVITAIFFLYTLIL